MKARGSTPELHPKLVGLRMREESRNFWCRGENESPLISEGIPVAKAAFWLISDAEARKCG